MWRKQATGTFFKKLSGIVDAVEDYEADSEMHDGEDQINA